MAETRIHQDQPVFTAGTPLDGARAAVVLMHGRGATAQSILALAGELPQDGIAYLAPQAANQTWYPNSGFIPVEGNQPYVASAFETVAGLLARIADAGIPAERVALGGFSQGACLAAEFVARHPRRYGGLFVLSGALLGPVDAPRDYPGSLDGTPVYVGGANRDSWVTEEQLRLTGRVLEALGAVVRVEVQPDSAHTIRQTEIAQVRALVAGLVGRGAVL